MLTHKYDQVIDKCWGHVFIFPTDFLSSQYFSLDMVIERESFPASSEWQNVKLKIVWQGSADYDESAEMFDNEWEMIADESTTRAVLFPDEKAGQNLKL
jgi:hypothetical protein